MNNEKTEMPEVTVDATQQVSEPAQTELPATEILTLLEHLNEKFEQKILTDEWKNLKYDEMHNRMLQYQDDLLQKTVDPLLKSIILLADSIKKDIKFFGKSEENTQLCDVLSGIVDQIDSILYEYDVEPFDAVTDIVDPGKQKIVKTISTNDADKNNQVAEILTTGYMRNDKVYRMERVHVYKFTEAEDITHE